MVVLANFLIDFLYYFVDLGVEIFKLVMVFIVFFGMRRIVVRKSLIFNLLIWIIFSFIWCVKSQNPFFLLLYVLFIALELHMLYSELYYKELFSKGFWALIFINIIDAMVYKAASSVLVYFNFENEVLTKIFTYIIVLTFLFMINSFVKEKVQFVHKISTRQYIIYLFIGLADYLLFVYVCLIIREMDKKGFALIISIMVFISTLLQYGLIFLMTITNEGLKVQNHLNQKYMNMQQENYEYLELREEETKKFRHDYRSHLNSLQLLCKEKRYKDVLKYIEAITERLNGYNTHVTVGDGFIDAILNYYYQKMEKNNIKLKLTGKMTKNCNIDMFDLCTIISNLLDNAIEAVVKVDKNDRYIDITFRYDDLMLYFNVRNPYIGELHISQNVIVTKKVSQNHGYGLLNVKKSVELYNGSMDIKTDNNIFEVLIALVNKNK
jgi:Histidine kinase-, DNA gyrase B-, and HSP90-like ATPase.